MSLRTAVGIAVALGLSAAARSGYAQYGMGMPGGGMPPPSQQQQPKDEGPAEQAPEEEGRPSDLEPLSGYTDQGRKRAQLFELDGYFRMRTDYMHGFALGQGYSGKPRMDFNGMAMNRQGLPPFPVPLSCPAPTEMRPELGRAACGDKDLAAANVRFRLEPTLNVTDQVRVRSQIDILDNTILGSTPDSLAGLNRVYGDAIPQAPVPSLYNTQYPPEIGTNGYLSSIRAKRAWAEIDTEFGSLRFGRMPWHFGRGISYNDGSCLDCTGGTTVDRIAALTEIYSHQLMLALDFGSQGLTSGQLGLGRNSLDGYPIDLAQDDDVFEYVAAATRIDNPIRLRERIDRGEVVFNYGAQVVYRTQQMTVPDDTCDPAMLMDCPTVAPDVKEDLPQYHHVNALLVRPNIWMKLYYRSLTVEFEGAGVLGKMDRGGILLEPGKGDERVTFAQMGWVLASELRLYRDAFFLGLETGGATGDQAEDPSQYLNYRYRFARQPTGDRSIRDFKFSPEYHVDSIFFRHILGTVTNAIYVKPGIAYWFDLLRNRQLGLSAAAVYSMAQVPVSTPGNSLAYGLELNAGATYRNTAEGFYAGLTWGVFFPLAALDRRPDIWATAIQISEETPGAPATPGPADAKAAQVIRGFLGVKF